MLDTSFAIHPGKKAKLLNSSYTDIGKLLKAEKEETVFLFQCEFGFARVSFYTEDTARVTMNPAGYPSFDSSFALIKEPENINVNMTDEEDKMILAASRISVAIQKKPFRISVYRGDGTLLVSEGARGMGFNEKKEVICYKEMDHEDHFYGFGEKSGFLNKRGEKMTMWNTDVYAPHNPEIDSLYQSIPFFTTLRNGRAHGIFFDNTVKSAFDLKTDEDSYSFGAEGGQLDYYVMTGPTPKEVLQQYTELTGRMNMPPKWAIGYHQSRYSYETEAEDRALVQSFQEKGIPVDAIYLDIHYMDGYRVFTFDHERFPNPKKLVQDLLEMGIRVVPIVDPRVKEDPEYKTYQEGTYEDHFCKYIEGHPYFGDVWPGESAFPDFTNTKTREWWGRNHKFYSDMGNHGIWNDMNEPAVFNETKTMDIKVLHGNNGHPKTHRELHNVYGLLMGESTYNGMKKLIGGDRPFLLTRAGYASGTTHRVVYLPHGMIIGQTPYMKAVSMSL
ncbi:TIM-barrel domain-containing protein [Fictibacillus sp. FJAT-27399]|uniref:glycoside hydrolase family 31 protein n=1 Tax=Fictibacillus sp. FJAT-27399 TaxID=1729689 RepID=UPI0007846BCC|nr:TIM-barrel domain-containing protein [Fictibacillus sp. FJAT-27399]